MACQISFCGQVLANGFRGNKVPGGLLAIWSCDSLGCVTRTSCSSWSDGSTGEVTVSYLGQEKSYFKSWSNHSLCTAFSGTAWKVEKEQSWGRVPEADVMAKADHLGGQQGLTWVLTPPLWHIFGRLWNDNRWRSLYMIPQPRGGGLSTLPGRQRGMGTSSHHCILGFQKQKEQQDGTWELRKCLLGWLACPVCNERFKEPPLYISFRNSGTQTQNLSFPHHQSRPVEIRVTFRKLMDPHTLSSQWFGHHS